MSFLLDTHAFLWWMFDDARLSASVREIVADGERRILVSSASAWEIATKFRLGKLPAAATLVTDLGGWIERAGFRALPIEVAHAQRAGSWTQKHRDPFDRMPAAQSAIANLPLLTADPVFADFGIRTLW